MKKDKKKTIDHCPTCSQQQRVKCSACGTMVYVKEGTYDTHEHSVCMGSHIEWKVCSKSEKPID